MGKEKETKATAVEWLLDTVGARGADPRYKVIRIDHPDIKDLIGGDPKAKLFSLDDVVAKDPAKVERAIDDAARLGASSRSVEKQRRWLADERAKSARAH